MKLGSLFDGIGGWCLAAERAGIEPVWSSEIETFPMEVTKRRFPNVKQLGDIRNINGAEIEPVDIITAGSPCQDFSVANDERRGLEGERSGLFTESVRIVRQMRMSTGGVHCRFYILENVPGILSSNKGMDFRTILEHFTDTEIPIPRSGKWANAGLVRSRRCDVGWRILDAQYFRSTEGLFRIPQRRRRLWLVADFAESGRCASQILFERKGLQGDNPQKCRKWEDPSSNTEKSIRTTDSIEKWGGNAVVKIRSGLDDGHAGKGALVGLEQSFTLGCNNDQTLFQDKQHEIVSTVGGQNATVFDIKNKSLGAVDCHGKSPTITAYMGTGGNNVPILTENIPDIMSIEGGQSAYAIGNGQVHQLYLQKKCGALNCMVDPMKIMQEIPTELTSQEACAPTIMCSTDKMLTKES